MTGFHRTKFHTKPCMPTLLARHCTWMGGVEWGDYE